MRFIPSNCFVEEPVAFLLLAPKAGADEANTIDDNQVRIGPWGKFVVQLKPDVIGVIGVKYLTIGHRRSALWATSNDGAILFLYP